MRFIRLLIACATFVVPVAAHAEIVAHYTFDDAGNLGADSTGSFHGTPEGDAEQTAGVDGSGALMLDGDRDFVLLPGTNAAFEALDDDGDGWTVAAWVKTRGNGGVQRLISTDMPEGWAGGGWGVGMRQDRGSDEYISTTYGVVDMQGATGILDGTWNHVAYVFRNDGGNVATDYFINGTLEATAATGNAFGITGSSNDYVIGRLGLPTAVQYFNGAIDDLRIYDNELSSSEIAALVPEPNSALLAILGGVTLLLRRRSSN